MTTYRVYKDNERELRFPLAVSIPYQNSDRTPTQIEHRYRKRSAIESSYRLFRNVRLTSTQDSIVRFAFVVVGFLLENLWLVLR